ncbi:MAG: DinB family protein [Chloroflexota bacterium]
MQEKFPMYEGTHGMRDEVLDTLTDADLAFNPGGANVTFGALWREMGEVEYAYVQSLKTFTQNFTYHNDEAGLHGSAARLKAWFSALDAEMKAALEALSDEDWKKLIKRDSGFETPIEYQMEIYLQALLVFFGKVSVYLKAMNKPLTKPMQDGIW